MKAFLLLLLLSAFTTAALALGTDGSVSTVDSNSSQIVALTDEMIARQIELERFYLKYKIVAGREPKWRWLRYPLLQDAQAALALASDISQTSEFGKNLNSPNKVRAHVLRGGYICGLLGTITGATSSGVELGANSILALRNRVEKHDPASSRKYFIQRLKEIDEVFQKIDTLLSRSNNNTAAEIMGTETRLLKYYRDWEAYEFADMYADAKSTQAGNNVFYALNLASNAIGAPGYILAIRGLITPRLNGPSAVCSAVDDCISMISAPSSALAGEILYRHYFKAFGRELKEKLYDPEANAKSEFRKLHSQVAAADAQTLAATGPITSRLSVYSFWITNFDVYLKHRIAHLKHLEKVAEQNIISGPSIAAGDLSQDILNMLGYYEYRRKPKVNNALGFAGGIAGSAATGASVYLTTQWLIEDAIYRRKLARKHEMPEDELKRRLHTLDEIEHALGIQQQGINKQ